MSVNAELARTWTPLRGRERRRWLLTEIADGLYFEAEGQPPQAFTGSGLNQVSVRRSWLGSPVVVAQGRQYKGLSRRHARELEAALSVKQARASIESELARMEIWYRTAWDLVSGYIRDGLWIPESEIVVMESSRPHLRSLTPEVEANLSDGEHVALTLVRADLRIWVADNNETIVQNEMRKYAHFFSKIERSPLNEEQIRAVVTLDNRVSLVAAAGSGKTSVMIARAAYSVMKGIVTPEQVVLLAFNTKAAKELGRRVSESFAKFGLPSDGVRTATFHSLGLEIIGRATGRKPRVASWVTDGKGVLKVERIVQQRLAESAKFRWEWELFRFLYAEARETEIEEKRTFRTYSGEPVRSNGERLIADWLYLNHVDYRYETPYRHDVATADYSQYSPDFYYPEIDAWHEHWAVDADGRPVTEFAGYGESMQWKRQLHRTYGTDLIETTWHEIESGEGLAKLGAELESRGATLAWNPVRSTSGAEPPSVDSLAKLLRTFMGHVKSNSYTRDQLAERLARTAKLNTYRTRLFLSIYWAIHDRWNSDLQESESVDFDDMLVAAAQHLESGSYDPGYEMVLVDEFQDSSQARGRMVRALLNGRAKYLLAVGDDWQAINRFAGADISLMRNFENHFGKSQTLFMRTNYRSTRNICEVSSQFVSRNPSQIRKDVVAHDGLPGAPVAVLRVSSISQIRNQIEDWLDEHASELRGSEVRVLGRYHRDCVHAPRRKYDGVTVKFATIHSMKGDEADYVIIPNTRVSPPGFPSNLEDDPVLGLAMPEPESFPHAEERRLMYVALTRAKKETILISVAGDESAFVSELITIPGVVVSGEEQVIVESCPRCRTGRLIERSGPYGGFFGCSNFAKQGCQYTRAG